MCILLYRLSIIIYYFIYLILLYIVILFSVCSLFWFSCQYLPSDWLERLLWGCLILWRSLSPQRPGRRALIYVFRFRTLFHLLLCVCPQPWTIYFLLKHTHRIISSCAQALYALRVLRAHGMDDSSLQIIYQSVIISKLTYASSPWWGFTSAADRQRLEGFIRRSHRSRFVPPDLPAFADICLSADEKLFSAVITQRPRVTRDVQKVLQLDHKEEWKCYKLHFIFQYNHHWVQCICDIFLADC